LSALHDLALAAGILPSYYDVHGTLRHTSDETREALLAAMGHDVGSETLARRSLDALRAVERERLLEPVQVEVIGSDGAATLAVHLPDGIAHAVRWQLEVQDESGETHRTEGEAPRGASWTLALPLPALPLGYHQLRVAVQAPGMELAGDQTRIVVPPSCVRVEELLGERPAFGLVANLYSVRRERDWGVGDVRTLAMLLDWAADTGGSFVGVNPLHALRNRDTDVSPYSPVSRLFRNPLYIDVPSVPEWATTPAARAEVESPASVGVLEALRDADRIDYARAWALKRGALERLHDAFVAEADERRRDEYMRWCAAREPALTDFATFSALQEERAADPDWRNWPRELQEPRSAAVRAWRDAHANEVDLHRWLQWVLDTQLREAQAHGKARGLVIGLYQDLAIGTNPAGSDAWSFGHLFVPRVNVGAPPDPYSDAGQDWGLPPIDPSRLRETRYDYWVRLLRSAFDNAGALRVDHVMGLFRLFWIPWGMSGRHGAYVRYPSEDLLGILALESRRHQALVVGEDLGTVPPEVPPALERWGILSSSVMMFMRGDGGSFLPAHRYPRRALATATTHDMVPLAGFWKETDIDLRLELGLAPRDDEPRLRAERAHERDALLARLRDEGVAPDDAGDVSGDDGGVALRSAVHAFVSRTPAALVGYSLDDLAGEDAPVNVPGVGPERFPCWTKRMRTTIEAMRESGAVEECLCPRTASN